MLMQADLQASAAVQPVIREPRIWHPVIVAAALRQVTHETLDTHRPELHYMRGPAPRGHDKHACDHPEQGRG
jgi:hypothetical protein